MEINYKKMHDKQLMLYSRTSSLCSHGDWRSLSWTLNIALLELIFCFFYSTSEHVLVFMTFNSSTCADTVVIKQESKVTQSNIGRGLKYFLSLLYAIIFHLFLALSCCCNVSGLVSPVSTCWLFKAMTWSLLQKLSSEVGWIEVGGHEYFGISDLLPT